MNTDKDISLPIALLLFGAIVAVFLGLHFKADIYGILEISDILYKEYRTYILIFLSIIFLNTIISSLYLRRLLGLSKQGARLNSIRPNGASVSQRGIIFLVTLLTSILMMTLVSDQFIPKFPEAIGALEIFKWQSFFFKFNLGLFAAFVFYRIIGFLKVDDLFSSRVKIKRFPKAKSQITLGTSPADKKEKWVSLDRKALNGSILITGSIGSGKTAGAMLPYFKQVLTNFDRKSILAIDPKRTFVDEAQNLIDQYNPESIVRRITLGGTEKYNPIYLNKVLKNTRFLVVTKMLMQSAANFSNDGSKNSFWDQSAFNLVKNSLIYCAAMSEYYTLNELYSALIRATTVDLADDLEKMLLTKKSDSKFDEEELFNINCAINYFKLEFKCYDQKIKTSVLATATSFLNQFQEYQASQIFCPPKDERTILSIDEVVDKGEIILFDVDNPALAKSMGTIIKLQYEDSILTRVADKKRGKEVPAFLIIDEAQDVVSSAGGDGLGDDRFLAKCREANAICIMASQSYSSIQSTFKSEVATRELVQNFRTRIAFHSADEKTINNYKELVGQSESEKKSHSISEIAQKTEKNYLLGGFDSKDANISESINISTQKEWDITGREFTSLGTFEAWGLVYNGKRTELKKLYMKPNFLERPETVHSKVLDSLSPEATGLLRKSVRWILGALTGLAITSSANAFPSICSVINQPSFRSCFSFNVSPTMCGSFPPRPCARLSYYVPQTFIETTSSKGLSHFSSLPIAAAQLAGVIKKKPYGAVNDDDTQSFQARTIAVPLTQMAFSGMPCGGARQEKMCFDGMSEHIDTHWSTGKGDLLQPAFLAWKVSPKLCLLKGAATSVVGGPTGVVGAGSPSCSMPFQTLPVFPPSGMPVCTGWGVMFPRYGTTVGGSEVMGSLNIASRIKSLSVEVFKNMPAGFDEKWSMLSPNSSQCFREFENMGKLETFNLVNNRGRTIGKDLRGNLFTTWKRVSCTRDWAAVPFYKAQVELLSAICKGLN